MVDLFHEDEDREQVVNMDSFILIYGIEGIHKAKQKVFLFFYLRFEMQSHT